jgi:hypothetical protein
MSLVTAFPTKHALPKPNGCRFDSADPSVVGTSEPF